MEVTEQPEIIEADVRALTHGGSFVCESPQRPGKRVYIREVMPGEKVRAQITKEDPWLVEAELVDVLSPSPARIDPLCPKFRICGGCDLQHIPLKQQRELKRDMAEHMLLSKTGIAPRDGVVLIGTELPGFNYRRRIILHMHRNGEIGYYEKKSGKLIELDHCYITDELINAELKFLIPFLKAGPRFWGDLIIENHGGEIFLVLKYLDKFKEHNQFNPAQLAELKSRYPNLRIHFSKDNLVHQRSGADVRAEEEMSLPAGHFFQVNEVANQTLVDAACAEVQLENVTELYAGAGNFTIPLARLGKKVLAVEADRALVRYGETLVKNLGLSHLISFHRASVERFIKKHDFTESLLLDPPRSGAEPVVEKMKENTVTKEVVYVSCSLPTLIRDLKGLLAQGFVLEKMLVLDMFSQTHHVETISVLRR